MTDMRVLTVRQPWAWAIVHGGKDVENRTRRIVGDYTGLLAIHVALNDDDAWEERDAAAFIPHTPAAGWPWPTYSPPYWADYGHIIGVVDLVEVHDRYCDTDDYPICSVWAEFGAWHLVLANPRPLSEPLPFRGALHLQKPTVEEQIAIERRIA